LIEGPGAVEPTKEAPVSPITPVEPDDAGLGDIDLQVE
jgi:hypothetical protein